MQILDMEQTVKKSITWVTPDYFVDCDFNYAVLQGILKEVDINWIILLPETNARFAEKDFKALLPLAGLQINFMYWQHRARNPKMLFFYEDVYQRIQQTKPDLVYFNYVPTSPYILPLYWRLNKHKTIVTAHDGSVKQSFHMPAMAKAVFKLAFGGVKYVNMFSGPEAKLFQAGFPKAEVSVIPLGLKDFGAAGDVKPGTSIKFLFFGSIHSNKNLGLLIDAACGLYEAGFRGFKVAIHGACNNWEDYAPHIKYPEIFECDIRMHDNSEIPGLFASSHYVVFPYKEMSQSGALKVAFNYNVPVITSDLKGFTDEVINGVNGFTFRSNDLTALKAIMAELLSLHAEQYDSLLQTTLQHNTENYSAGQLANKYLEMFNKVFSKN